MVIITSFTSAILLLSHLITIRQSFYIRRTDVSKTRLFFQKVTDNFHMHCLEVAGDYQQVRPAECGEFE